MMHGDHRWGWQYPPQKPYRPYLVGGAPPRFRRGAVRGEEALDISDGIRLLGYLFLGGDAPPNPGPTTCGADPTDDDLGCATATRGCTL